MIHPSSGNKCLSVRRSLTDWLARSSVVRDYKKFIVTYFYRSIKQIQYILCHCDNIIGIKHIIYQYNKLIPAQPRNSIIISYTIRKPLGNLLQQDISCAVSQCVIYDLKPVKIKQHHCKQHLFPFLVCRGLSKPVIKEISVGQAGQGIVSCLIHQLLFKKFSLGYIMNNNTHSLTVTVFKWSRR